MTRYLSSFLALILLAAPAALRAQTPTPTPTATPTPVPHPITLVGQITNSGAESFAGAISGDGRFVVFESRGNLATENPRNADGNVEIFLFDYAQRRIFQITDTKNVLFDVNGATTGANVRVEITNRRPVISNDGRWIAFSSNATASSPEHPNGTNPGSFIGNCPLGPGNTPCSTPTPTPIPSPTPTATPSPTPTVSPTPTPTPEANPVAEDGNLEIWLYQIPAYAPADLTAGDELPLTNLSGGTFTAVTNTPASRLPVPATSTTGSFIASDNHDASINDDGTVVAFSSTRNLVSCVGNTFPENDNDEIFVYVRGGAPQCDEGPPALRQITRTPRGNVLKPIYNKNASISGSGNRVVFASTGDNPVFGNGSNIEDDGGENPVATSWNEEIFYADLLDGTAQTAKQVTVTTPTSAGSLVNILDFGKRISRDGRYIAFDSFVDFPAHPTGNLTNTTSFALYLYDTATSTFTRIGPRSDADSAATGGDVQHFPGFTDNNGNGTPSTLLFETRLNIKPDGTIPTTESEGLNPFAGRMSQLYAYGLEGSPEPGKFVRLSTFPLSVVFVASTQPLPSDTSRRFAFNLALTELGLGNGDLSSESFYMLRPPAASPTEEQSGVQFLTGASRLPVTFASPSPTPTVSPTPTPTPSPTPTPNGSPTPTPAPTATPVTPSAVFGLAPGMLAFAQYGGENPLPVVTRTAVGSLTRSFTLPIELSGVSVSVNGAACGIKSVSPGEVLFVVPPALLRSAPGVTYPYVIYSNGLEFRGELKLTAARPDLFANPPVLGPGGRADLVNVTNRVHTTEPFTVTTIKIKGGVRVASQLRLRLTGVDSAIGPGSISIRIGSVNIPGTNIVTGGILEAPGVYTVDFTLPSTLNRAGDQPIILTVTTADGSTWQSRLDDTAPRVFIL